MNQVNVLNIKFSKEFTIGPTDAPLMTVNLYCDGRNVLNTKNVRWVDSGGRVGGELSDLGAWDPGRRVRLGVRVEV
jgi:hypothetical protein